MLIDGHGREVRYIRLSITDRCNLRCFYCRAEREVHFIPHEQILTYEEMIELVGLAQALGVAKIRLTGGEPFVRRDFLAFLGMLKEKCPGLDVRVTTNGTLLSGKVPALKHLGVRGVNISLDTLDAAKFARITGRDFFHRVRAGLDECLRYGIRVKVNVVGLKGVNDEELSAFLELARENPIDVRFIEFMPIGCATRWSEENLWPAGDILEAAKGFVELRLVSEREPNHGPARMFDIVGGQGRIGLISPMSDHFCDTCNRLRITADGGLRTCLFSDREFRLAPLLRSSKLGLNAVRKVVESALKTKPLGYKIMRKRLGGSPVCGKAMTSIGG
ncbi:MAG: GTP 3',8-cyclase MoaA [Thermodesulfobacteriota bacterium]|nr:GTP 3',8-cyclase MoaA [Thermodesulfobacteriota bacterium]